MYALVFAYCIMFFLTAGWFGLPIIWSDKSPGKKIIYCMGAIFLGLTWPLILPIEIYYVVKFWKKQ